MAIPHLPLLLPAPMPNAVVITMLVPRPREDTQTVQSWTPIRLLPTLRLVRLSASAYLLPTCFPDPLTRNLMASGPIQVPEAILSRCVRALRTSIPAPRVHVLTVLTKARKTIKTSPPAPTLSRDHTPTRP